MQEVPSRIWTQIIVSISFDARAAKKKKKNQEYNTNIL